VAAFWTGKRRSGVREPRSGKSNLLTELAQELVVVKESKLHFTKCALLMQNLLAAKRGSTAEPGNQTAEPL
jgi:hypothetical protein